VGKIICLESAGGKRALLHCYRRHPDPAVRRRADMLLVLGEGYRPRQDEVDVNTNPKIGPMRMMRGRRTEVSAPGVNHKRCLAGPLNWRTGMSLAAEGPRRKAGLFVAHLEDLCRHLRRHRSIHLICDNAIFHNCRPAGQLLQQRHRRIVLHFLPKHAPEANPIECIWRRLHEEITRNHRCKTPEELLHLVFERVRGRMPFLVDGQTYHLKATA